MNIRKLRGKMVERDVNVDKLATILGQNKVTVYRKLRDCDKITIGDANAIKRALRLSDAEACEIFLPNESHKCDIQQGASDEGTH